MRNEKCQARKLKIMANDSTMDDDPFCKSLRRLNCYNSINPHISLVSSSMMVGMSKGELLCNGVVRQIRTTGSPLLPKKTVMFERVQRCLMTLKSCLN
jgi:hypothetical protein